MTEEQAYEEMKKRGWGFAKSLSGFFTLVGPMTDGIIDVWAADSSPVKAVEKALLREQNGPTQRP